MRLPAGPALRAGRGDRLALTGIAGDAQLRRTRRARRARRPRPAGPWAASRAARGHGDGGLAGIRDRVSRGHADRRGAGADLDDAARRRHRRDRGRLPGPDRRGQRPVPRPGGRRARLPGYRGCHGRGNRRGGGAWRPADGRAEPPARGAGRDLPDHRGLAGLLAVHLGDDRHAQGRDAPAWFGPGSVRDLRYPGTRDHAGRPVPVRGQGLLRLRAGKQRALPALGRGGGRTRAKSVATRDYGRTGRVLRRDPVLRWPDVLLQHAARPCPRTPWPGYAWPPRPGRLSRLPCTSDGRHTSVSTSSMASA